jgi:hypothetical protein
LFFICWFFAFFSGLTVSPNQTLPCESVHGLTLSLRQPNDIEPLALNFPFPILVNDICATLDSNTRSIDLILKKALYEPWPFEFQATTESRWNVDNLKPWKDGSELESELIIHLGLQYKMMDVIRSNLSQNEQKTDFRSNMSASKQVRRVIDSLMLNNQEFVCIRRKDSPQTPNWYIRVHLPVRVSPLGSPILLLSAIDIRSYEKFSLQGKVDVQQSSDDFNRIFEAPRYKKNPDGDMSTIWTFNSEEEQLLRYVLRLNSTKIVPSTWQKKNLPQGENNSWLATFVSPLYDDFPVGQESLNAIQKKVQTSCGGCNKIFENLKRCSRCRSIFYCSVECQRGHWTQHKNECKNSEN